MRERYRSKRTEWPRLNAEENDMPRTTDWSTRKLDASWL